MSAIFFNRLDKKFNLVDATLLSGLFYYIRATVSEEVGAEVLVAYGLMKTGINCFKNDNKKTGTLLLGSGAIVTVHVLYSCAKCLVKKEGT